MDRCTGSCDRTEILLKTALNTIQLIGITELAHNRFKSIILLSLLWNVVLNLDLRTVFKSAIVCKNVSQISNLR